MKSLDSQLQDFLSEKIEPKLEKKKIIKEHKRVREKIAELMEENLVTDFLMGSYIRNTLTKRLNPKEDEKYDVDVMLVFDGETYQDSDLEDLMEATNAVAEQVKEDIEEIVEVRKQKVSIGLLYEDNFKIDLVPAIEKGEAVFTIYDSRSKEPVETNPLKHNEDLSELNDICDGKLVPLIKLIKRWKDENEPDTFKSFHLERLAIDIFTDKKIGDYLVGLRDFFKKAYKITENSDEVVDPVNEENDISEYLDAEDNPVRDKAIEALGKAEEACQAAIDYEAQEKLKEAKRSLGRLYEYFRSEEDNETAKEIAQSFSVSSPSPHYRASKLL